MPLSTSNTPPSLFPSYLVPSLPFRRRKSSTDSNISFSRSSTGSVSPSTSPQDESYLAGHASHLRCGRCLSDLALANQIISKGFTGRHGRAYLVAPSTTAADGLLDNTSQSARQRNDALPNLPNTYTHRPVPRQLVTGAHTVSDVSCAQCSSVLGWKYIAAEEESQKYKVGKFILETKKVCRSSIWENDDEYEETEMARQASLVAGSRRKSSLALPPDQMPALQEEIEFDSQDEDECEDLFLGTWTPQLAARRRKARVQGKHDLE